jgi:hypothetical protein
MSMGKKAETEERKNINKLVVSLKSKSDLHLRNKLTNTSISLPLSSRQKLGL